MKLIIELSENDYKALKEDGVHNHLALADTIIAHSMPYEENPQAEISCDPAIKLNESNQDLTKNNQDLTKMSGDLISREALKEHAQNFYLENL